MKFQEVCFKIIKKHASGKGVTFEFLPFPTNNKSSADDFLSNILMSNRFPHFSIMILSFIDLRDFSFFGLNYFKVFCCM